MEYPFIWRLVFLAVEDATSAINILRLSKRISVFISVHDTLVARFRIWVIYNIQLQNRCKRLLIDERLRGINHLSNSVLNEAIHRFNIDIETHNVFEPFEYTVIKSVNEHFFLAVARRGHGLLVLFQLLIQEFKFTSSDIFRIALFEAITYDCDDICRFILNYQHDGVIGFGIDVNNVLFEAINHYSLNVIKYLIDEEDASVSEAAQYHTSKNTHL